MNLVATSILLVLSLFSFGQNKLPCIYSGVEVIDLKKGEEVIKNGWTIMPELKPDVLESSAIGEELCFFTDRDSICFEIQKDKVYDFVILQDGKDSAFTRVAYAPSHLDILKGAKEYDLYDEAVIPKFTYQDSSAAELKALRQAFQLDSIAGGGNQVSQILNLMHWIHDLVPHDGNHDNPVVKNAMSMIEECKRDERGLNCRGLATVLNECYLSLGIKSRFVTCMPKDSIFDDCHVINMVFADDLDKWIWIDPTHDAYIMDEAGNLLGLAEVRERLIDGRMLILNPDANWNNKASTVKEYYLYEYMAKNLYRFDCPLNSVFDYETKSKGKKLSYVELLPLDGYSQTPKVRTEKSEKSGLTYEFFKTNNPVDFWAKP